MPSSLELFGMAPPEGQERRALLGEEAEARAAPQLDAEREEKLEARGYIE